MIILENDDDDEDTIISMISYDPEKMPEIINFVNRVVINKGEKVNFIKMIN
jgi:hypothetical protein